MRNLPVMHWGGLSYPAIAPHNWTLRTTPANNSWSGVCWAAEIGLLVAVAYSGVGNRVMTSPNGVDWTLRTSASDDNWFSVAWNGTRFVAVGSSINCMVSTNGIDWSLVALPSSADSIHIQWAASLGLFVVMCGNGATNKAFTSPDGLNWTQRTMPSTRSWHSAAWSPELGLLVAVALEANITNGVATSPDGTNWTLRTMPSSGGMFRVVWAPALSLFVVVGNGDGSAPERDIMTSPDGVNWTLYNSGGINRAWLAADWSPSLGLMAAVAQQTTTTVMRSTNGSVWTLGSGPSPTDKAWQDVEWAQELGMFVAVGAGGTGNRVMTSTTGA